MVAVLVDHSEKATGDEFRTVTVSSSWWSRLTAETENLPPKSRYKVRMLCLDLYRRITMSPDATAAFSVDLADELYSCHVRKLAKQVLDSSGIFRRAAGHTAFEKGKDRYQLPVKDENGNPTGQTREVCAGPGRSVTYGLPEDVLMVPIRPTCDPSADAFETVKQGVLKNRRHTTSCSLSVTDGSQCIGTTDGNVENVTGEKEGCLTGVRKVRAYYQPGLADHLTVSVSNDLWVDFRDRKRAAMECLWKSGKWRSSQRIVEENLCRLVWDFASEAEKELVFGRVVDEMTVAKAAKMQEQLDADIAKARNRAYRRGKDADAAEARVRGYARHQFDEAGYRERVWANVRRFDHDLQRKSFSVFRKLGRLYGSHNSLPRPFRKYLRIEHRDGELERLAEVDIGCCFLGMLGALTQNPRVPA